MEVEEIKSLIEVFERTSLTELELQRGESRLVLKRESLRSAAQQITTMVHEAAHKPAPPPPAAEMMQKEPKSALAKPEKSPPSGYIIAAPIVGTFYRRPGPGEEPYVEVGDRVNAGDTVCLVEAMKVMNEVRTERAGTVKEILVLDGKPVEYGQPLITLEMFES